MIGITSPGGYYSPIAAKYLNYVAALRYLLLHASKLFLELLGYDVYLKDVYSIKYQNKGGVHVGYDCIGYGVLIFWTAFIFANNGSAIKKILWIAGGLFCIFIINVIRISLLLIANINNWNLFHKMDHHLLFNITAYLFIFIMIYFFDRSSAKANFEKA